MRLYRATFERLHFSYSPPLRQTAEVLFRTDADRHSDEEDHLNKFESAMWDAMWEQNPHWKNPHGPEEGRGGWSSVLGGYDIALAHVK